MTHAAPLNTRYSLSVLSTASVDSRPSLLVTFDNHRYLFNTPEAISRVCVQSKIGMKKMGQVFLGELRESAGLPGFILSTVEAGTKELEVFGPTGTEHFVASCRFFTRREHLSLKITTATPLPPAPSTLPSPIHADPNLVVYALPLSPLSPSATPATTVPDVSMSPPASLKRKRSSASPSPPPRPKSPPPPNVDNPYLSSSTLPFDPIAPSFSPSTLRGPSADLWRSLVLADMFRGKHYLSDSSPVIPPSTSDRRNQTPAYMPTSLPPANGVDASARLDEVAVSYLAVGPPLRGKFLPEEAAKKGVQPRDFKKLVGGERVWVPKQVEQVVGEEEVDGKKESKKERHKRLAEERKKLSDVKEGDGEGEWVESKDCLGEGQAASAFLVLNIPTPAHLASLPSLLPSLLAPLPTGTGSLVTIFYFLGPGVLASPTLHSFASAFPASVTHHLTSPDLPSSNNITFVPSALLQLRLSYLDPSIFRLPVYSFPSPSTPSPSLLAGANLLRPNSTFSQSHAPLPTPPEIRTFDFTVPSPEASLEASRLKGTEKSQSLQDAATAAWNVYQPRAEAVREAVALEAIERAKTVEKKAGDDMIVTPLGTGSAIPSKYRNVSSTLLELPPRTDIDSTGEKDYVLLDCGEGTWGQIARRFGEEGAREVLARTRLLFVSHLHQDHHAGLATLLRERAALAVAPSTPLLIVGPPGVRMYTHEQQQLFDLGLSTRHRGTGREVRFIDCGVLEPGKSLKQEDWRSGVLDEFKALLGVTVLEAVPVLHRCRAWGLVLTHSSGCKAVFSGDTMPCEALVLAGQDATLLIHEATIEDDMPDVARAKGHSTFGQAIDVARRMRATHLLLTHFSARYPKLPPLTRFSVEGDFEPTVALAFDLASMPIGDFWKLERYREAMDLLFSWDELEERGAEPPVVSMGDVE